MIISIFLGFIGGLLGFKINILLWKQVSKSYVCQINYKYNMNCDRSTLFLTDNKKLKKYMNCGLW